MKIKAVYDGDTKRFHKYQLLGEQVKGTIYFSKDSTIPDLVRVEIGDSTNKEEQDNGNA